jgi:hypothetical protein
VLTNLAPKLKDLGYIVFFDEMPGTATIESNLTEMEKSIELYEKLRDKLFDESDEQIDIYEPEHLKNEYFTDPAGLGPKYLEFIEKHRAFLAMRPFLNFLKENKIEYRGVDIESIASTKDIDLLLINEVRNKSMINSYLEETKPVYGRAGIIHAPGMHQLMLNKLPSEQVDARCMFFYIHSRDADIKEEQELRSDKFKYLIDIDAAKTGLPQVCDFIIDAIKLKTQELKKINSLTATSPQGAMFKSFHQRVKNLSYATDIKPEVLNKYFQDDETFKKLESLKRYLYNDTIKSNPSLSLSEVISLSTEEVLNLEIGYHLIQHGSHTIDQVKKFNREQRTIIYSSEDINEAIDELARYAYKFPRFKG